MPAHVRRTVVTAAQVAVAGLAAVVVVLVLVDDEMRARFISGDGVAQGALIAAIALTMAQKWFDLANGPATNLDAALREFNTAQMRDALRPAMQQQQQI